MGNSSSAKPNCSLSVNDTFTSALRLTGDSSVSSICPCANVMGIFKHQISITFVVSQYKPCSFASRDIDNFKTSIIQWRVIFPEVIRHVVE